MVSRDRDDELNILEKSFANHLKELLTGKIFLSGNESFKKIQSLTFEDLDDLKVKYINEN